MRTLNDSFNRAPYIFARKRSPSSTSTCGTVTDTHAGASLPMSCTVAPLEPASAAATPVGGVPATFFARTSAFDCPAAPPFICTSSTPSAPTPVSKSFC